VLLVVIFWLENASASYYYSLISANCFRFMKFLFTWYFLLFLGLAKKVSISSLLASSFRLLINVQGSRWEKGEASQASYFVWTRSRNMHKLILFYSNRSKFKSAKRRERNTSCPLCHTEPLVGSESGSGSGSEFELVAKTRKGFQLRRVYGQDRSRNRSWAQLPTVVLQLAMKLPLTLTKKQLSPHFHKKKGKGTGTATGTVMNAN